MTHTFFTGTYSVKSDCSRIGVPFTRSKKAEAEKIFISTFFLFLFDFIEFRFRSSSQDFEFNSIFYFLLIIPKRRVFATFLQFISNQID